MAVAAQTSAATSGPSTRETLLQIRKIVMYAVLIAFGAAMIFPFIFAVSSSFKTLPDIADNPAGIIPQPITTEAYNSVLTSQQSNFPRWTFNSAFVAVVVTIGRVFFSSLAGYALARLNFPGKQAAFFTFLGTMMIPLIVLLVPRYIILTQLGMTGTYQGIIVPMLVDAFGIFMMKQFFESIPREIEEAAFVDGAGRFVIFFRVILPMATPALAALSIFAFQGAWNDFLNALIVVISNRDLYTLPLGLAILRGAQGNTLIWNQFFAGSVITTLPMAIIFFAFQRYFVEGVNYSGLAGQ